MAVGTRGYNVNKEGTKEVEIAVPLKYLGNFWRMLDIPLINCAVSLTLSWSENCVTTSLEKRLVTAAQGDNAEARDDSPTNAKFKIKGTKLCVPVVTLSAEDDTPTFTNVNRLFVLSYKNENDRTFFSKYYVPKVEIKDFIVLIDGKPFFEIPVKNKEEEAYEAIIEMSKNNDYTTGNLLDYEYFSKHYKLIATDLSKQIELENVDLKQQINFIGRLG